MRIYASLLFLILLPLTLSAQKTEKVCGEYIYYAPADKTLEQAKLIALERAKLQALADEFGTIVSQSNASMMKNENGKTDSHFFSLSSSEVKGEWIENLEEPEYQISYEQNMLVVKCTVCGKARSVTNKAADFTALILRNGVEEKFADTSFRNGDDMFLAFQAPADGYIAVYLIDQSSTAYCLLPYQQDNDGQQPVKQGEKYVFFSPRSARESASLVDEYTLTCKDAVEYNQVYVIFSPNPFTKAIDSRQDSSLPRELSYEKFAEWLSKCRKRDERMGVKKIDIEIKQ
ncbi:DUF4384 domain-containing protein [uncultured Bacteroides sp.]|uniref:DUF4384 domain-containing protein n=1 Tax=uncultured Bacteroides sp. TaxID=162156 RepID=UPI002675F572|nr:DUF4384 domain-containing protein [uncultured Bacteroides sp.]